ncbi:hypothetical protein [Geitlerinema sp. PCC 7407]|uniref:hypothetical protein n=1 Tax=Geitlerinema sp. PCC 7407 TaxID=1173025 RepID=UPI00029FC315|nr:hypothetical protein [Geitlerinema sp. PCC 7407]AFY67646.1 hypothetical protein GEI7407_3178 [Geitlerinema sp. PCC 7407]
MRAWVEDGVVYLHPEDVPQYKKSGSVVRNTFFWALKSIAGRARSPHAWEYEAEVWLALQRLLMSFTESGYLGYRETVLEFPPSQAIPEVLRPVATWGDEIDAES